MAFTNEQRREYYRRHPELKARYMRTWQSKPKKKAHLATYARNRRQAVRWRAEAKAAKDILEAKIRLRQIGVAQQRGRRNV